jgi:hypothetical protein
MVYEGKPGFVPRGPVVARPLSERLRLVAARPDELE